MKLEGNPPRSMILRWAWLRGVNCHFFKLLHSPLKGQFHKKKQIYIQIMLKKGYIFHFCKVPGKFFFFYSAQYDTAHSMIQWFCAESVFATLKCEYRGENETKNENILYHWSVAPTESNDEKNRGYKISLDFPFKGAVSWDFGSKYSAWAPYEQAKRFR